MSDILIKEHHCYASHVFICSVNSDTRPNVCQFIEIPVIHICYITSLRILNNFDSHNHNPQ